MHGKAAQSTIVQTVTKYRRQCRATAGPSAISEILSSPHCPIHHSPVLPFQPLPPRTRSLSNMHAIVRWHVDGLQQVIAIVQLAADGRNYYIARRLYRLPFVWLQSEHWQFNAIARGRRSSFVADAGYTALRAGHPPLLRRRM